MGLMQTSILIGSVQTAAGSARGQAREYIPTLITELSILLSQLLVYKFAAYYLGHHGFALYAVARRTISLLVPLPLLGLSVGLPRYIGRCVRKEPNSANIYYGASIRYVAIATLLCVVLINTKAAYFSYIFLGDREYATFALPLSLMLLGLAGHNIVYAYFRGHLEMRKANVLQFTNLGLVPLLCFLRFHNSAQQVLLTMGALWCLVAIAGMCFTPFRYVGKASHTQGKELLRYGFQRIPGDFLMAGLLALPVTFVAHGSGLQKAGFLAFGVSMLSMIGAVFTPIGLILLPKASSLLASDNHLALRQHVVRLAQITLIVTLFLCLLLEVLSPLLIRLYLGKSFSDIVPIIRLIALAAVPYGFYFTLRGLVDAFHVKAVNTFNIAIAFSLFLLCSVLLSTWNGAFFLTFPLVLGLYALGFLTVIEARKILA
jgi:O-antigen/teichoic acid export membrane protein